jgi:DNA transposition AAA+ family ATPase
MNNAQELAIELGNLPIDEQWLQAEINRLNRKSVLHLAHVNELHYWLEGKRKAHQSCRIVGESRTGKTVACESYVYRNKPQQKGRQTPTIPVLYLMPPSKCGFRDLFTSIINGIVLRTNVRTSSKSSINTIVKVIKLIPTLPHPVFEYKPPVFNWIKVRRVGWQIQ